MVEIEGGEVLVTNTAKFGKVCGRYGLFSPGATRRVPMSFIAEYGADTELKLDFSLLADHFRTRTQDGRVCMDWWCPLSMIDGYGRHALGIYQGLQALSVDVRLRASWIVSDRLHVPTEWHLLAKQNQTAVPSKVAVAMTLPYDPILYDNPSQIRIALTQFETDHMPKVHVEKINLCDHLIVTSSFQPAMMRRSGVRIPISVLTPGVDTEFFRYVPRARDGLFKVLILGALTGRKNPLGAIRIFQEASGGAPDWRLTIKSRRADGIGRVAQVASQDPRISVIIRDDPPANVLTFYARHDALLWPSKGEGCGLPPLEAMATGMEVVSSNNSGMADFVEERWAWPIPTKGMERSGDVPGGFGKDYVATYGDTGSWWVPDEKQAVTQLRRCFDAWYRGQGKGQLASQYVRARHTLELQARSVLEVVNRYV